jgi:hypothetical protein
VTRTVGRLRGALRRFLLAGVRVVAGVSVALVLATVAMIALLFRSDADRADLVALQRRMSDRLVERSFHNSEPAKPPQGSKRPKLEPSPSTIALAPGRSAPNAGQSSALGDHDGHDGHNVQAAPATGSPSTASVVATDASATSQALHLAPADNATPAQPNPPSGANPSAEPLAPTGGVATAPTRIATATAPEELPPSAATDSALHAPDGVPGPPAARNPWLPTAPRELRLFRRLMANGGRAGERSALALRTYNQQHFEDPRGHLLLGQLYFNRFWRPDALAQFAIALQLDLSVRGAPELLPALVDLVVQGKVAVQAEKLIIKSYGSEALTSVDAAIANEKDPSVIARLQALRSRLGS